MVVSVELSMADEFLSCVVCQQNASTSVKRAQREEAFIAPAEKAGETIEERKRKKKDDAEGGEKSGKKRKRSKAEKPE